MEIGGRSAAACHLWLVGCLPLPLRASMKARTPALGTSEETRLVSGEVAETAGGGLSPRPRCTDRAGTTGRGSLGQV